MKKILILLVGVFLYSSASFATTITSTAPGGDFINGYQPDPQVLVGNSSITGHMMFKKGLTIPSGSTLTWNSDGFVNGPLTLNNGVSSLLLASDLTLGSTGSLVGRDATIPLAVNGTNNCTIYLSGDTTIYNQIKPSSGTLTIDGRGHQLKLTTTRSANSGYGFNIASGSTTVVLKNMTLVVDSNDVGGYALFKGTSVTNTNYILENVHIRIKSSAPQHVGLASSTTLTIRGNVTVESPSGLICLTPESAVNLFIEKNSTLKIGKDVTFVFCAYGATMPANSFTMADRSSVFHLDGCVWYTAFASNSEAAANILGGSIVFENKVRIYNTYYANTDGFGTLTLGDGTAANDVDVRFLGSAYVSLAGHLNYNHS